MDHLQIENGRKIMLCANQTYWEFNYGNIYVSRVNNR